MIALIFIDLAYVAIQTGKIHTVHVEIFMVYMKIYMKISTCTACTVRYVIFKFLHENFVDFMTCI